MKIIQRVNPHNIVVKFSSGRYQGRIQTSLSFEEEYVAALRSALDAIRAGKSNVSVIQYRETLHNHAQLADAARHLNKYSTDDEVIEQVHHSSRSLEHRGLLHLLKSTVHPSPLVWASL